MTLNEFKKILDGIPTTDLLPLLFVGHGNPMNAIENNVYTEGWAALGKSLPVPAVILSISAHWLTEGTYVHIAKQPRTIHDFWGFPDELYRIQYPCSGAPEYAHAVQAMLTKIPVHPDSDWGIDHGTWSVLHHMYPRANIPVFQMSIDLTKSAQWHYDLAKQLMPLREKGVLILGSGNIVHNLSRVKWGSDTTPYEWALEFDAQSQTLIETGDHLSLINYEKLGHAAMLSIPTPDHYWPFIYTLGLQKKNEIPTFPVNGIDLGSVSMRAVLFKNS